MYRSLQSMQNPGSFGSNAQATALWVGKNHHRNQDCSRRFCTIGVSIAHRKPQRFTGMCGFYVNLINQDHLHAFYVGLESNQGC